MSEDENFLARWSRRKLDTEREKKPPAREQTPSVPPRDSGDRAAHSDRQDAELDPAARGNEQGRTLSPAVKDQQPPDAPFDPATLPPVESIGAGTDIRDFLRPGVPDHLKRAALRRAWTSDPNIRDFIGIAENQWDFTAPDGVPGFGPLKAVDDVRRMVTELTRPFEAATEPKPAEPAQPASSAADSDHQSERRQATNAVAPAQSAREPSAEVANAAPQVSASANVALQQEPVTNDDPPAPLRRSHGRALPD